MPELAVRILGAGGHVGRSAAVVVVGGRRILIDCGIQLTRQSPRDRFPDLDSLFRPVHQEPLERIPPWKRPRPTDSQAAGPFTTSSGPSRATAHGLLPLYPADRYMCDVDLVLVTHYHLDHVGALPYLTEVLGYTGPVLMTEPTRAQAGILLEDCWLTHRPSQVGTSPQVGTCEIPVISDSPTSEADTLSLSHRPSAGYLLSGTTQHFSDTPLTASMIGTCLGKVQCVQFDTPFRFGSLAITARPAGHVLGACMFEVGCGDTGQRIVYTGDFTTAQSEWMYRGAQVPLPTPTILISECTYGSQVRESDVAVKRELCCAVEDAVRRGGNVLIPVSAMGKAQDIAAMLALHWSRCGLMTPIALSPGVMRRGWDIMASYGTWTTPTKRDWDTIIRPLISVMDAQTVLSLKEPVVYLSVPRSLDSGPSREIFQIWGKDPNNLILFPGFVTPGTVAHRVLKGAKSLTWDSPKGVASDKGGASTVFEFKAKLRYLTVASHADTIATQLFVRHACPQYTILVHGEMTGIIELAKHLRRALHHPVVTPVDNEDIVFETPLFLSPPVGPPLLEKAVEKNSGSTTMRQFLLGKVLDLDRSLSNHKLREKLPCVRTRKPPSAHDIDRLTQIWAPQLLAVLDTHVRTVGGSGDAPRKMRRRQGPSQPEELLQEEPPRPASPTVPEVLVAPTIVAAIPERQPPCRRHHAEEDIEEGEVL